MAFGRRLKSIRNALGISQREMASALGIQGARYNKYEIGRSEAPYNLLIKISKLGGKSLDYLIGGEAERKTSIVSKLAQVLHVMPLPAVLYDHENRLLDWNSLYKDTLCFDIRHVLRVGTLQETVLRTWAYAHDDDPQLAEEFIRARLNHRSELAVPVEYEIGARRLHIAESYYPDCKLVVVTDVQKTIKPAQPNRVQQARK